MEWNKQQRETRASEKFAIMIFLDTMTSLYWTIYHTNMPYAFHPGPKSHLSASSPTTDSVWKF